MLYSTGLASVNKISKKGKTTKGCISSKLSTEKLLPDFRYGKDR